MAALEADASILAGGPAVALAEAGVVPRSLGLLQMVLPVSQKRSLLAQGLPPGSQGLLVPDYKLAMAQTKDLVLKRSCALLLGLLLSV